MTIRVKSIIITTPSQALAKIDSFNSIVERLVDDNYKLSRLRTQDMNSMLSYKKNIRSLVSIAVHARNQERAKAILNKWDSIYRLANDLENEHQLTGSK